MMAVEDRAENALPTKPAMQGYAVSLSAMSLIAVMTVAEDHAENALPTKPALQGSVPVFRNVRDCSAATMDVAGNVASAITTAYAGRTVSATAFLIASKYSAGMMVAEDHAENALSTIPAMKANVASLSVMGRTAGMMVAVESAANVDLEPSATVTASVNANQIAPISFVAMTAVVDLAENVPPTKPVMGDTVVNPNATEVTAATTVAAETVENVMVNVWMVFVAIQAALGWIVGMMVVGDRVENALSTRPVTAGTCCAPQCEGKQCGDDGCGGDCGSCAENSYCGDDDLCHCVPACFGLVCGDDGCGGSCGECGDGQLCDEGTCICAPDCGPEQECGDDGCGGSCGTCYSGYACNGYGQCRCQPNCTDLESATMVAAVLWNLPFRPTLQRHRAMRMCATMRGKGVRR